MAKTCFICGQKIGGFFNQNYLDVWEDSEEKFACKNCFDDYMGKVLTWKKCNDCNYFNDLRKATRAEMIEKLGIYSSSYPIFICGCKKLDLELKPYRWSITGKFSKNIKSAQSELPDITYFEANNCAHYITKEDYRTKALRGDVVQNISESHFVICEYCKTEYDKKQHTFCPKCGSS